jgi:hypothetical protein
MSEIWSTNSRILRVIVKLYNSFSTISQKRHVLLKKVIENKMCPLSLSTNFVWNIFHYNTKWARYDQASTHSVRVIVKLYKSFSSLSQKRHVLRKNVIENKMCILILSTLLSEMFFIIIRNERDMIKYPRAV